MCSAGETAEIPRGWRWDIRTRSLLLATLVSTALIAWFQPAMFWKRDAESGVPRMPGYIGYCVGAVLLAVLLTGLGFLLSTLIHYARLRNMGVVIPPALKKTELAVLACVAVKTLSCLLVHAGLCAMLMSTLMSICTTRPFRPTLGVCATLSSIALVGFVALSECLSIAVAARIPFLSDKIIEVFFMNWHLAGSIVIGVFWLIALAYAFNWSVLATVPPSLAVAGLFVVVAWTIG